MTAARGANADGLCAVVHGRVDTARYQTDLPYRHGVDFAREQSSSDPAALKRQVDTIEGNRSLVQQQRSARIAG